MKYKIQISVINNIFFYENFIFFNETFIFFNENLIFFKSKDGCLISSGTLNNPNKYYQVWFGLVWILWLMAYQPSWGIESQCHPRRRTVVVLF